MLGSCPMQIPKELSSQLPSCTYPGQSRQDVNGKLPSKPHPHSSSPSHRCSASWSFQRYGEEQDDVLPLTEQGLAYLFIFIPAALWLLFFQSSFPVLPLPFFFCSTDALFFLIYGSLRYRSCLYPCACQCSIMLRLSSLHCFMTAPC